MTIDAKLTEQVRAALASTAAITEIKMFGGIGFMLNGNMVAGTSDRGLLVRVGEANEKAALARPGASTMAMRNRAVPGYIRVAPDALDAKSIKAWVKLARSYVATLPPKKAKKAGRKKAKKADRKKPSR